MLKKLICLSALTVSMIGVAHADSISGYFSANGTNSFTSNTITFDSATVQGALGGTFASYLTDGNVINFLPGSLPYANGNNSVPLSVYPSGYAPLFTTTENGETFTFELTSYTAGYITDGSNGCSSGATCLDATGNGFFSASGPITGTSGAATFAFTSQYVPMQPLASITTFSASTSGLPASPVPEPASLLLVGSSILGFAGLARRKLMA